MPNKSVAKPKAPRKPKKLSLTFTEANSTPNLINLGVSVKNEIQQMKLNSTLISGYAVNDLKSLQRLVIAHASKHDIPLYGIDNTEDLREYDKSEFVKKTRTLEGSLSLLEEVDSLMAGRKGSDDHSPIFVYITGLFVFATLSKEARKLVNDLIINGPALGVYVFGEAHMGSIAKADKDVIQDFNKSFENKIIVGRILYNEIAALLPSYATSAYSHLEKNGSMLFFDEVYQQFMVFSTRK